MRLALARGIALKPALELLAAAGLPVAPLHDDSRSRLTLLADGSSIALLAAADVPAYIEAGAADAGFAGKDWLLEQERDLFELLDLGLAAGRLVFAAPEGAAEARRRRLGRLRVATAYPGLTRRFFGRGGRQIEVVPLQADVELAPKLGLADGVVVLVRSGAGLQRAGLREHDEIARSSLRLVAGRGAHAVLGGEIGQLTARLRALVEER